MIEGEVEGGVCAFVRCPVAAILDVAGFYFPGKAEVVFVGCEVLHSVVAKQLQVEGSQVGFLFVTEGHTAACAGTGGGEACVDSGSCAEVVVVRVGEVVTGVVVPVEVAAVDEVFFPVEEGVCGDGLRALFACEAVRIVEGVEVAAAQGAFRMAQEGAHVLQAGDHVVSGVEPVHVLSALPIFLPELFSPLCVEVFGGGASTGESFDVLDGVLDFVQEDGADFL